MVTAGIILAAGTSARMGRPKALLRFGETTFLRKTIDMLATEGVSPVVAVLGRADDEMRQQLQGLDVITVFNEDAHLGQLSSLKKGLLALGGHSPGAVVVYPVDHPLVKPETVRALLRQREANGCSIVIPTYGGLRGHPVIFPSSLFDKLLAAPLDVGARHVVRTHPADVVEFPADDPGILQNIDTPDDYARFVGRVRTP